LDNGELQLNDLQVVDSTSIPWLKIPLLGCLGLVHRCSFRRKGLATALLAALIQRSRQRGVVRITGKVVAADLNAFPGLAEMYRRCGFELTSGIGNTSYFIEMQL
jgi:predicted acetyltransferase